MSQGQVHVLHCHWGGVGDSNWRHSFCGRLERVNSNSSPTATALLINDNVMRV